MKLNKFGFKSMSDVFADAVFLDRDDKVITLTKINRNNLDAITNSIPVVRFVVHTEEKKIILSSSCETYERLIGMPIIDETVESPLMKQLYDDFISQYTKYILTGEINVS